MEIYMVREEVTYEAWNVIAAYLSKADAEAHAEEAQRKVSSSDIFYTVEKWEVN